MNAPLPLHTRDETFCVRAYECDVRNCVTLPSCCNYLQEIAGNHARDLGLGIQTLQEAGFTWMLARLRLAVSRYAAWRKTLRIRTWPAGTRGRVTALRDFVCRDEAGALLLEGVSEWLYVDLAANRIVRLPPAFAALAPEGTPRVALPPAPEPPAPEPAAEWSATLTVRRSDHDFNNHVNNAHYVAWALECLPDDWTGTRQVGELDIAYKSAAAWGDTILSEAARAGEDTVLHRIRRLSDRTLLASARTVWREHKNNEGGTSS
ncbi:MAG: thioesterase [Kiritimatiellia bacterium]|jgi:acyl-ACP thioesterase|nr:thioesterase [Kiritimatiellia bacterium]